LDLTTVVAYVFCHYCCALIGTVVWLIFIANVPGNIRNLAMEKVAGSVLFPCRYVSNGCNATMPHTDKSSHEDGCEFRSGSSYLLCSLDFYYIHIISTIKKKIFGPPVQSSLHENWKLSKIMITACYSVSNVLRKAIAFPLWSAIDSR